MAIISSEEMDILNYRKDCFGACSTLEGAKLVWGGSGGETWKQGRRDMKKKGRKMAPHFISAAVNFRAVTIHEPLKIIYWLQVGCLLSPHFSHLMSAHLRQCSVPLVIDSVGPPWDSTENKIFYLIPYQGCKGICSSLINSLEITEHS